MPHLFEFMDLPWLSSSLRQTLREILDLGNSAPFRTYYSWVARSTVATAIQNDVGTIYEVGAGTGPICRHILSLSSESIENTNIVLRPCDINPDSNSYRDLQMLRGRVNPIFEPVDFTMPRRWDSASEKKGGVLLLFSANFHHLSSETRVSLLKKIIPSCDLMVIAEPLHNSLSSILFVFFSIIPALLLPVVLISKTGRMKRFLWCWIIPLAPLLFIWDGVVSSLRQWSPGKRNHILFSELALKQNCVTIERTFFSELITIKSCRHSAEN